MMKKIWKTLCIFSLLITLCPLYAHAESEDAIDLTATALTTEEDTAFNEETADEDGFIHLVIQAAEQKERNISLEGVHAGKNIKLYGIKSSENILQSLYDTYQSTGRIESAISEDFAIVKLYVNQDKEYVDSLVFIKDETSSDENEWTMFCSGSMLLKDEFITRYSESNNVKKFVKNLGIEKPKQLKILCGIPNMPASIYFVQDEIEYLIPLEDTENMQASQVYLVSDVVEGYLIPILEYQAEKEKEYENLDPEDIPIGTSLVPEDLDTIAAVDLVAETVMNVEAVEETVEIVETKSASAGMYAIPVVVVCIILFVFFRFRNRTY
jgi:hypothetical protein